MGLSTRGVFNLCMEGFAKCSECQFISHLEFWQRRQGEGVPQSSGHDLDQPRSKLTWFCRGQGSCRVAPCSDFCCKPNPGPTHKPCAGFVSEAHHFDSLRNLPVRSIPENVGGSKKLSKCPNLQGH